MTWFLERVPEAFLSCVLGGPVSNYKTSTKLCSQVFLQLVTSGHCCHLKHPGLPHHWLAHVQKSVPVNIASAQLFVTMTFATRRLNTLRSPQQPQLEQPLQQNISTSWPSPPQRTTTSIIFTSRCTSLWLYTYNWSYINVCLYQYTYRPDIEWICNYIYTRHIWSHLLLLFLSGLTHARNLIQRMKLGNSLSFSLSLSLSLSLSEEAATKILIFHQTLTGDACLTSTDLIRHEPRSNECHLFVWISSLADSTVWTVDQQKGQMWQEDATCIQQVASWRAALQYVLSRASEFAESIFFVFATASCRSLNAYALESVSSVFTDPYDQT